MWLRARRESIELLSHLHGPSSCCDCWPHVTPTLLPPTSNCRHMHSPYPPPSALSLFLRIENSVSGKSHLICGFISQCAVQRLEFRLVCPGDRVQGTGLGLGLGFGFISGLPFYIQCLHIAFMWRLFALRDASAAAAASASAVASFAAAVPASTPPASAAAVFIPFSWHVAILLFFIIYRYRCSSFSTEKRSDMRP